MNKVRPGSFKLFTIKGVPVFFHWEIPFGVVFFFAAFVKFAVLDIFYFILGFIIIIALHEFAHAAAAYLMGVKIYSIEISGVSGCCWIDVPPTFISALFIESAGLLAQSLLLMITIAYISIMGSPSTSIEACLEIAFILVNSVFLIINLIPIKLHKEGRATDGYYFWKILANRVRGRPYIYVDTSPTFSRKTRLAKIQNFLPPDFTTGIEILNDNSTTMDFVMAALMTHLNMSEEEAVAVILDVHRKGGKLISLPTYEIATSIAAAITSDARAKGFNLVCRPVDAK